MKINSTIKRIIQFIIIGIICFFLIKTLYKNWLQVRTYTWHFNYALLIFSFLILMVTFILIVFIWLRILHKMNARLPFQKAFKIWFIAALGRYMPGKIWQLIGMTYLANKEGVPVEKSASSAILAQALTVIPGVILAVLTLVFFIPVDNKCIYFTLLLLPISVVIAYPPFLERIINFFSGKLGRPKIHIDAKFKDIIVLMLFYLAGWLLYGIAFFLFTRSITDVPLEYLSVFPGIYAAAYLIGLFAIFVPAGLGIREGMLTTLLSFYFPPAISTAIALGARLWFTLAEFMCVLISLKL